jgi:hypothetical protein
MSVEKIKRTPLGTSGFTLEAHAGSAQVREVVTGVLDIRYVGLAHADFVPPIHELLDRRIKEGNKVSLCVDAHELQGYATEFRKAWTDWFRRQRGHYHQVPILFRSNLVRMGINLVNPLIGNMILPLSEQAAYEQALNDATMRARGNMV